ncbi:MAG TPA: hypothetical protein VHS31_04775, partial [Tepidisphaeraceae bacterium]|nr:hypothetical protein [Tepidisphaeraceae bacterium]
RVHSSGDYKHRPPEKEHAGLRKYNEAHSQKTIQFDIKLRVFVLASFLCKLRLLGYRFIAASIGEKHLHILVELPWNLEELRRTIGKCKQRASHAIRNQIPGSIWSEGGEYKWVKDKRHLHNIYDYIRTKQELETIVWSHRNDENWIDFDVPIVVMKNRKRKMQSGSSLPSDAGV